MIDTKTGEKINWRSARDKYGALRAGQLWIKRDTRREMRIHSRDRDNCWRVCFAIGTRSHVLKERDIFKYYERTA